MCMLSQQGHPCRRGGCDDSHTAQCAMIPTGVQSRAREQRHQGLLMGRACCSQRKSGGTSHASVRILNPRSLPVGTMRGMFSGNPPPVICTTPCACSRAVARVPAQRQKAAWHVTLLGLLSRFLTRHEAREQVTALSSCKALWLTGPAAMRTSAGSLSCCFAGRSAGP